jgi:hypothetical protein
LLTDSLRRGQVLHGGSGGGSGGGGSGSVNSFIAAQMHALHLQPTAAAVAASAAVPTATSSTSAATAATCAATAGDSVFLMRPLTTTAAAAASTMTSKPPLIVPFGKKPFSFARPPPSAAAVAAGAPTAVARDASLSSASAADGSVSAGSPAAGDLKAASGAERDRDRQRQVLKTGAEFFLHALRALCSHSLCCWESLRCVSPVVLGDERVVLSTLPPDSDPPKGMLRTSTDRAASIADLIGAPTVSLSPAHALASTTLAAAQPLQVVQHLQAPAAGRSKPYMTSSSV